jgi:hypothetical protein
MVSSRYITLPLDEGLVVAPQRGHRLFVMNGAARFIWERRMDGIADRDIPKLMAAHYEIGIEQAQRDFCTALRRWQAEGLVLAPGKTFHHQIAGLRFDVHYQDEGVQSAIVPILGHLELSTPPDCADRPGMEFNLAVAEATYILRAEGIEVHRSAALDDIIEKLTLAVIDYVYESIEWLVSLHAAAVGNEAACVLIPGASGAGKSTLTAALVASGAKYLTDDLVLLDKTELDVVPVPSALTLKSGSWTALELRIPGLSSLPSYWRADREVRYWAPPAAAVAGQPIPAKAIVFPHYQGDAQPTLAPLSALEALHRIVAAPCTVKGPITPETVDRLTGWASRTTSYVLTYNSLDDAVAIVERLLAA